jgi:hypothetical protein
MDELRINLGFFVHGWWREEEEMLSAGMTASAAPCNDPKIHLHSFYGSHGWRYQHGRISTCAGTGRN